MTSIFFLEDYLRRTGPTHAMNWQLATKLLLDMLWNLAASVFLLGYLCNLQTRNNYLIMSARI